MRLDPLTRGTYGTLVALLLAATAGCSREDPRGNLEGKVSLAGVPLTTGTVTLFGPDGKALSVAQIRKDEAYGFGQTPAGKFALGVDSPLPRGTPGGGPANPSPDFEARAEAALAKKFVPIPPKYKDPAKSGLVVEVKLGTTKYDIDLAK